MNTIVKNESNSLQLGVVGPIRYNLAKPSHVHLLIARSDACFHVICYGYVSASGNNTHVSCMTILTNVCDIRDLLNFALPSHHLGLHHYKYMLRALELWSDLER